MEFVAIIPNMGSYLVFVAEPAHVFISSIDNGKPAEWGRFKYSRQHAGCESSEVLCRRAVAHAITLGIIGSGPHHFVEATLDLDVPPWDGKLVRQTA